MASAKTPAKKQPVKRTASRTTAKKPSVAKKPAARRSSAKAHKTEMRSFRVYRDDVPFTRARVTRQTLYWAVLLGFIVGTQLWILKIQMDIAELTNTIMQASL